MSRIEKLEQVKKSLLLLIKAEKDVEKKSDKYAEMDTYNTTTRRRAGASDKLTRACFERDKLQDDLHADLINAKLTKANSKESYETRQITHSHGFGHTYTTKYTPKSPKCYL